MAAAKAVVVNGPLGIVVNAEAELVLPSGNYRFPLSNATDGYSLLPSALNGETGYIKVVANGFKNYLQLVTLDGNNQEIHVGGDPNNGPPNTIHLPALSFNQPSRDRIINVKANFCNLFDADDYPIFDAFIDYLIIHQPSKAQDWISRLKDTDTVHINLDLSGDYNEPLGWAPRYPIPGTDWTNDLDNFRRIIDFVLNNNFIPHIHLAADGQGPDEAGMTYGINWALVNLPEILAKLKDYTEEVLWNGGWDGCFPNWSLFQTAQFYQMLREVLGDKAQLAAELNGTGSVGYCHFGNGGADWYIPGIREIDSYLCELLAYPPNSDGIQQTAARMLGPAKRNIEPQNDGVYYLAQQRERSLAINMFETCAYQITRKQLRSNDAVSIANFCKNFGFTNFGNGLPDV